MYNVRCATYTGLQHIPVGPLTPEQEALAKIAFYQSNQQHSVSGEANQISMGQSGAIQRHTSSSHVKAFSGKGHTLSSSTDHTSSSSGSHTLSSSHTSSSGSGHALFSISSGSGLGLASGIGALRAGPSGPGRGGAAGGAAVGGRGRGRFVSGGSRVGGDSGGDSGIGGTSRPVQQRAAVERDQAHDLVHTFFPFILSILKLQLYVYMYMYMYFLGH